MKAITGAKVVLVDSMIPDGVILTDGGRITAVGEAGKVAIPDGTEITDAGGLYAAPGLVDVHTHAGGGTWFYDDPEKAAAAHLDHGTTSVLPALYFNLTQEEYLGAIRLLKQASQTGAVRIISGIYMEGPYLNPKFGCDAENNKWAVGIDQVRYQPLIDEVGKFAKVWCIAPEREGIEGFVESVKAMDPDPVFSVAHSEASPQQIYRFLPDGLKLATHHTNATGDRPRYPECRGVCVDEAVNFSDDIYAELICDSKGIHVDPFMLRLVLKIKGRDKVILISDACVFDGPIPDGYEGVTDINFDFQGEIAGSKLTLDVACANMMKHTGAGICDVFRFASYNPSRMLGMSDIGSIRAGNKANIILVDDAIDVKRVMFEGSWVR